MAAGLAAAGHLPDPRWREAFAAIPRHVFVPRYLRDDGTVIDSANPADRDEWLAAVYADTSLTTQTRPVPGTDLQWPTSSSTRPSLMARMLHLLVVADGHRVLEIGTGTGYHAAILCHRLGDSAVTSIDIDPAVVREARDRLATLGYRPRLEIGDGATGVTGAAPYDRIIATCAVATVPPAWIAQVAAGGLIVADVRGELSSSLAVLHKVDRRTVEGRFLPVPGHFMWLRAAAESPLRDGGTFGSRIDRDSPDRDTTDLDPAVLDSPDLRFLLQHLQPSIEQVWTTRRDGAEITHIHSPDGSWAEVAAGSSGRNLVHQGGPRRLWGLVAQTVDLWERLGRPGRGRFGLTAVSDAGQRLWLDAPDSGHSWRVSG